MSSHGLRLGVVETRTQRAKVSFLTREISNWFYDTSPDTDTRAARGGSLIEGNNALDAQGVNYEGTRWARGFTWFEPPERNTLRSRKNESCCIIVCYSSLGLNLP
jgi:hypothetical protein